jgi:LysM repeat protein
MKRRWRHKKIAFLVGTIIFLSILISNIAYSYTRNFPRLPEKYSLHVVRKGDTLWKISEEYNPEVDTRIGIDWIRAANGLPKGYVLQVGDVLNVPDEEGPMLEPLGQD